MARLYLQPGEKVGSGSTCRDWEGEELPQQGTESPSLPSALPPSGACLPPLFEHAALPQVHAGKDVLNSELVLPSGMGLSLGAMIHVMRRRKVMDGIFEVQGGGGRQRRERKGGVRSSKPRGATYRRRGFTTR